MQLVTYEGDAMRRADRPAVRCTARRKHDKQRCRSFAVHGLTVCRMHGGSAPQTKAAAQRRIIDARLRRGFELAYEAHQQRLARWNEKRIATTAQLLDLHVDAITPMDVAFAAGWYGRHDLMTPPAPTSLFDDRCGPRPRAVVPA